MNDQQPAQQSVAGPNPQGEVRVHLMLGYTTATQISASPKEFSERSRVKPMADNKRRTEFRTHPPLRWGINE